MTIRTLEDMLRACVLNFKGSWEKYLSLVEFSYNNSYHSSIDMAPYKAFYGRKCKSPLCWEEVGERKLLGLEIIQMTSEKINLIRERLQTAQSRQKSYYDDSRREVEFEVGDMVFLKVVPMKGVMRFGNNGRLRSRFFGPFETLKRIGKVAYELALPPTLAGVHNVFHVSMLRKYILDPSHVLNYEPFKIKDNLTYEKVPIQILDREDQVLCTKTISLVKVLWKNHTVEETSWEREDEMKSNYPELFVNEGMYNFKE